MIPPLISGIPCTYHRIVAEHRYKEAFREECQNLPVFDQGAVEEAALEEELPELEEAALEEELPELEEAEQGHRLEVLEAEAEVLPEGVR